MIATLQAPSRPIRVFVCDDVPEFRTLLRMALEGDERLEVVGEAGDGVAVVEGVRATRPDVILLDLSMPRADGLQAIPRLRRAAPESAIVVLSGFDGRRLRPQVLAAGAVGYIEKGESFSGICGAVLAAAESGREAA